MAAQAQKGIWISNQAGLGSTFEQWWDPPNADASRCCACSAPARERSCGPATARAAMISETARRASRSPECEESQSAQSWDSFDNWSGQGVRELAFSDTTVYAASFSRGVVRLDLRNASPAWRPMALGHGLPERPQVPSETRIQKLRAGDDRCGQTTSCLPAAPRASLKAPTPAKRMYPLRHELQRRRSLPPMWLFCSGPHEITVSEDRRSS